MDDIDIENVKELIKEYETVLPAINEQLQFYKTEHGSLKKEIINLTKENKYLSEKLEDCVSKHMDCDPFKYRENDLIENLKSQLHLSIKEKESVVELWRTSMTRIDYLERELKVYSANTDNSNRNLVKKLKKTYENELKTLKDQLRISNERLHITVSASKTSLGSKQDELEASERNLKEANEKVDKLHGELENLRGQIVALNESKRSLEGELELKTKSLNNLKIDTYEAKLKVAEACHVIEAALIEKDAALGREKEAREEIKKLTESLKEIVAEAEGKVKMEVLAFRTGFEEKSAKMRTELKRKEDELDLKDSEMTKLAEKCRYLEEEIDDLKKSKSKHMKNANFEKNKFINKYQEASQKLIILEHKNVQINRDLQEYKEKLQKLKTEHENEMRKKESQSKNLQSQVNSLETELQATKGKFLLVSTQLDDLNNKITIIDSKYKADLDYEHSKSEHLVTQKVSQVETAKNEIVKDLKNQLETQKSLNQKWKFEVREVTQKLEDRILALKKEVSHFKNTNNELLLALQSSERKRLQYKESLKSLCTEFNALAKNSS